MGAKADSRSPAQDRQDSPAGVVATTVLLKDLKPRLFFHALAHRKTYRLGQSGPFTWLGCDSRLENLAITVLVLEPDAQLAVIPNNQPN